MARNEQSALVFQDGGALGAYQAGAFEQLQGAQIHIDWVAGISIGAINAALVCSNPERNRIPALKAFWDKVTASLAAPQMSLSGQTRRVYSELAAAEVAMAGAPGFFRPRVPMAFWPLGPHPATSVYDTSPLADTLNDYVDFGYLNAHGPRLSVGATDIETGNFTYFDSATTQIDARHFLVRRRHTGTADGSPSLCAKAGLQGNVFP